MSDTKDFIIGIQFTRLGKLYHFKANEDRHLAINDHVLVETSRGLQLGRVAQIIQPEDNDTSYANLKSIIRQATEADVLAQEEWLKREEETIELARKALRENRISNVKIVDVEYGYSGESLNILVSSLSDEKLNIHPIREALIRQFHDAAINVRQVGPRDVAKIFGGIGACGMTERCCTQFLNEFTSISIRMAKEQEISLTPEEITGMCGRLRCCLIYEYDQYKEGRKGLPKKSKWVETPEGIGRVNVVLPLKGTVMVSLPDVGLKEFTGEEVTLTQRPAPSTTLPNRGDDNKTDNQGNNRSSANTRRDNRPPRDPEDSRSRNRPQPGQNAQNRRSRRNPNQRSRKGNNQESKKE
jgi:cell fate regulator YaaT (PSP1 superfamily)